MMENDIDDLMGCHYLKENSNFHFLQLLPKDLNRENSIGCRFLWIQLIFVAHDIHYFLLYLLFIIMTSYLDYYLLSYFKMMLCKYKSYVFCVCILILDFILQNTRDT